jgi:hypothetical protein
MQIDHQLYKKIIDLAYEVKENFRERGYVLPSSDSQGRIRIGNYFISRENTGFYTVSDTRNNILYKQINLPQTAALVANSLALRSAEETKFLEYDRDYGYYAFENDNYQRLSQVYLKNRDWARYEALETKQESAQEKAEQAKHMILAYFEKLCRLR